MPLAKVEQGAVSVQEAVRGVAFDGHLRDLVCDAAVVFDIQIHGDIVA